MAKQLIQRSFLFVWVSLIRTTGKFKNVSQNPWEEPPQHPFAPVNRKQSGAALLWAPICLKTVPNSRQARFPQSTLRNKRYGQHKLVVWPHPKFTIGVIFFYSNYNILLARVAVSAPGDDKRCYSHDAIVMSRWHDDDRIIAVQPMVICFSREKQVSVSSKDVDRPSTFFFPYPYLLALAVNKSPRFFLFFITCARQTEEKIEGLWTGLPNGRIHFFNSLDAFHFLFHLCFSFTGETVFKCPNVGRWCHPKPFIRSL